MKNYRCSVFCSFFKAEKFIQGYIDNMLEQTIFDQVEFIFLNCNSPENEEQYILPLLDQYSNIKYYKLDKDPGLYASWNIAIKLCSNDIISNWNADDRKSRDSIEILHNFITSESNIDMVYGKTYISRVANETYEQNIKNEIYTCYDHSLDNLLKHNSPHCMPMWKKYIHNRIGFFNENYTTVSDAAMWLVLSIAGGNIRMLDHPVGLYYWNPNGQSTKIENQQSNLKEISDVKSKVIQFININRNS